MPAAQYTFLLFVNKIMIIICLILGKLVTLVFHNKIKRFILKGNYIIKFFCLIILINNYYGKKTAMKWYINKINKDENVHIYAVRGKKGKNRMKERERKR